MTEDDKKRIEEIRKWHQTNDPICGGCFLFARLDEAHAALREIEMAECHYRMAHDVHGSGNLTTGYMWDQLRKAVDRARKALGEE